LIKKLAIATFFDGHYSVYKIFAIVSGKFETRAPGHSLLGLIAIVNHTYSYIFERAWEIKRISFNLCGGNYDCDYIVNNLWTMRTRFGSGYADILGRQGFGSILCDPGSGYSGETRSAQHHDMKFPTR